MRTYETIYIIHPEVVGDDYAAAVEKYKGIVEEQGGNILNVDEWGVKKLAYLVKKQARGAYVEMTFEAPAATIKELQRRMRIDEAVIKYQTIVLEKGYVPPVKEEEPAAVAEEAAAE